MLQMGCVEEVGSGMRNVYKYLPHYAKNAKAEFLENDMFTTTISLTSSDGLGDGLGDTQQRIINSIKGDKFITITELSKVLSVSTTTIEKHLSKLKENKIISRVGTAKTGHWEILISL